ncbi:MAG: YbhB/YbcL family Raf kinase inhibitor-like protein [Caldisericia bacterium]|nr:YbhB/YbcL family Raf kinase inhibitor-like protein [Caldisericia bacterium]
MKKYLLLTIILIIILFGCSKKAQKEYIKIFLTSGVIKENNLIPKDYTCEGKDISPQLEWSNVPNGTVSFCLIMDDPDAPGGVFTHWIIFNIPSTYKSLPENFPKIPEFENGIKQGKNDFNKIGYNGPCPPIGSTHQYRFTIYAIDKMLNLESGVKVEEVMKEIENHILGKGEFVCIFSR